MRQLVSSVVLPCLIEIRYAIMMDDLANRLRLFVSQVLSVFIDMLFLGGWVVVNWGAHRFVFASFPLEATDTFVLHIVQLVFAVSTFFPVLVYIVVDLLSVTLRARQSVQQLSAKINPPASGGVIQDPQAGASAR